MIRKRDCVCVQCLVAEERKRVNVENFFTVVLDDLARIHKKQKFGDLQSRFKRLSTVFCGPMYNILLVRR